MEVCEACGKITTNSSIHSEYGIVCSGNCYDWLREKKLEAAAKAIENLLTLKSGKAKICLKFFGFILVNM